MFYVPFTPTRRVHVGPLFAAFTGLLTACGLNPPQAQSEAVEQTASSVTATPVDERRLALTSLGNDPSPAIGQGFFRADG